MGGQKGLRKIFSAPVAGLNTMTPNIKLGAFGF